MPNFRKDIVKRETKLRAYQLHDRVQDSQHRHGEPRGATAIWWSHAVLLDALDAEIRSVFDPSQLIIPDSSRKTNLKLEQSVL